MGGGIPSEAVGVSVGVLLYSNLCLTLSVLLVCLLWSYGERWTYVTLLTIFTSISTLGSIAQQIHYATHWEEVKQAQYDKAIASLSKPALAFGGAAQSVDVVLYWIQFYCYNVMSLMVLFWTMALFRASWGLQIAWLGDWRMRMELVSKIFGVLFPALIIGLANTDAIINVPALDFIVMNILMFFNLTAGSVLLVLILAKYLKTRRLTARNSERSPWWASNQKSTGSRSEGTVTNETIATNDSAPISARQSIYDRALVTRFTIGFVILAVFEMAIIMFALFQSSNNNNIALSGGPDHSVSGTTIDIVLFIPGVSASLVVFLVFGTTKSWRQYWNMVAGGCGARTKLRERSLRRRTNYPSQRENEIHLDDFERLPSRTSEPDNVSKGGFALPPQRPITELTFDRMELPADINLRLGSADSSDDDSINRLPIQSPDGSIHPRHYSRSNTIWSLPV